MSFLGKMLGGGIGEAAKGIGDVVDQFIETPDEERDFEKFQIEVQTRINEAEAKHRSFFIAGARPFILWVCGIGLAYHSIIQPCAIFLLNVCIYAFGADPVLFNQIINAMPVFDTEVLMTLLFGLLGLGSLRTYEKYKGLTS